MRLKRSHLVALLILVAIAAAVVGRACLPFSSADLRKNEKMAQQATEDANAALAAADRAAMSARRAADSTRQTAEFAAKSAKDASDSAKDASSSANKKPVGVP